MMEYFAYKRFKKHQLSKKDRVLSDQDQDFIDKLVNEKSKPAVDPNPMIDEASKTPLPRSPSENGAKDEKSSSAISKGKAKAEKATSKFKLPAFFTSKGKDKDTNKPTDPNVPAKEASNEEKELTEVLDRIGMAAENDTAFSFSPDTRKLLHEFTQVLKDVVNGVPEAGNDLIKLLDRRSGQLDKLWAKLPGSLKEMVESLPFGLAPEVLATAAGPPGVDAMSSNGKVKKKSKFSIPNIPELIAKPGMIVSVLKGALNALKTRFPAFMGTNALISLALMVVLMFFWYCHKRGKEVRLEKEAAAAQAAGLAGPSGEGERMLHEPMAATPAPAIAAGEPLPSAAAHSTPATAAATAPATHP